MTHEIHKNPTNPQQFKGKTVVITGGGGVLCSTMAEAMAGSGARVAILDLKPEVAQQVVRYWI
jgi:NAD(P)-dependent dehydrogenase (short-subunit alcohol dehydrogenase family)